LILRIVHANVVPARQCITDGAIATMIAAAHLPVAIIIPENGCPGMVIIMPPAPAPHGNLSFVVVRITQVASVMQVLNRKSASRRVRICTLLLMLPIETLTGAIIQAAHGMAKPVRPRAVIATALPARNLWITAYFTAHANVLIPTAA